MISGFASDRQPDVAREGFLLAWRERRQRRHPKSANRGRQPRGCLPRRCSSARR